MAVELGQLLWSGGFRVCVLKSGERSGVLWGVMGCSRGGVGNGVCVCRGWTVQLYRN